MEYACLLRAATLLDDPLMMEWALHYYADLPLGSKLRETLATLWFHDLKLQRWINGDDLEILDLMLRYLPEKCFTNFLPRIAAHWGGSSSAMLNSTARVLVGADPALAVKTFGQSLKSNPHSLEHGIAILDVLDRLPPVSALPLFEKLLPMIHGDAGACLSFLQAEAFGVAVQLNQVGELPTLLDGIFTENGARLESMVEQIGYHLFAHDSYLALYFLHRSGEPRASFVGVKALFHNAAPLAEMDTALSDRYPLAKAMKLLETHHDRCVQSNLAWDVIRKSKRFQSGTHAQALAALALAGVAAAFERKTLDVTGLGVDETLGLLCVDIHTNIHYDALLRHLREMPDTQAIDAVCRYMADNTDGNGKIVLARLMGDLAWNEFVPTLLTCIDKKKGNALCEAAASSLIRIGKSARDAVIAQWDALDTSQKTYGSSVIRKVGGTAVAEFILERSEELLQDDVETWCQFLLVEPDARLIDLVRPQLHRNQHGINETFYRLCCLQGIDSPELTDLRPKLVAYRKTQNQRLARFANDGLVEPSSVLNLPLRCNSCGDVNYFPVKKVILGDPESGHPFMLADEFPCLSCGEFVEFKFEAEASVILMGEAIREQLAQSEGKGSKSRVLAALKIVQPDGSQQDAPQAYALLREKVANKPDDWLSWFRLANINNGIHRPIAALACLEKAYTINPLSFDTILNLASTLADNDQESAALYLMNTALESRADWQILGFQVNDKVSEFAKLFNQLRVSTGREDLAALHPQFFKPYTKVGRNDPCPCGSGRKFKKCCMQKNE
jgi:tetratricopeptide (TPR) repeat protein